MPFIELLQRLCRNLKAPHLSPLSATKIGVERKGRGENATDFLGISRISLLHLHQIESRKVFLTP